LKSLAFKDLEFHSWAKSEGLTDEKLCEAAAEIERGLIDARLGGFLIKNIRSPCASKQLSYQCLCAPLL